MLPDATVSPTTAPDPSDAWAIRRAKIAIAISWIAVVSLGSMFIYRHWLAERQIETARLRTTAFVVIMTCVHLFGFLAYKSQFADHRRLMDALTEQYWPAMKTSLKVQAFFLILSALMLDTGEAFHGALVVSIAYWALAALIVLRRPESPTRVDLFVIRWGYFLCYLIAAIGSSIWWLHVRRL